MTKSYTLTLDVGPLNERTEQAFKDTAFLLGREFTRVITTPRYWSAYGDTRDIVDKGTLRSSQQLVFTGPLEGLFSWPVAYAAPVHEGYTKRNGQRVDGRPWTEEALKTFDAQQTFIDRYQAYGG